jgi:eukaryotic-like serine/threonine-protein kinase
MPSVGDRLGPYEILALIGSGGMGEVYKARDTRLDRIVAVKVSKTEFSERFEREARVIATLNHPHICQLYDVGPNYLVMEYIEGTPLKGPLPLDQALKYGVQTCDALDAAHKKSVTHRDLKPANILVTKAGVKLLDFGLAKIEEAQAAAVAEETVTRSLTQEGAIVGTLQYASPEQLQSKRTDTRSDIFSFGLVLYEMLTGKRAFEGSSAASVIAAVLEREAPSVADVAPASLDRVLRRCLAKDPDDRWQTARDLKTNLEWIADVGASAAAAAAPARSSWRERAAWIAVAVVLAAAMSFFAVSNGRTPPASETVRFSIYPPEKTTLSGAFNTTVSVPGFALSPDGRAIVFTAAEAGAKPILWLRTMEEVAARPLPGTEDADSPFWSWDGRWVGFFAGGP